MLRGIRCEGCRRKNENLPIGCSFLVFNVLAPYIKECICSTCIVKTICQKRCNKFIKFRYKIHILEKEKNEL